MVTFCLIVMLSLLPNNEYHQNIIKIVFTSTYFPTVAIALRIIIREVLIINNLLIFRLLSAHVVPQC